MPDQILVSLESIGDDCSISPEEGRKCLTEEELTRADAFHFPVHRNRYIRGRALLRTKLSQLLDCDAKDIQIDTKKYGKPFVPGSNLAFNLSHSEDLALFGFSTTLGKIGVDIECIDRKVTIDEVSKRFFTTGECSELQRLSGFEKQRMFFYIWTAKEARMKLNGEGLNLDPTAIDLAFQAGLPSGYLKPEPLNLHLSSRYIKESKAVSSIVAPREFEITVF